MGIVTVSAVIFGRRMFGRILLQLFLLFRVTGEAQFIARDGWVYRRFVSLFFVFVAGFTTFCGCVHHSVLDQLGVTRRTFRLANLLVLGGWERISFQQALAR